MKIALIGAGGKMGCRITDNLLKSNFETSYVEIGENGLKNLKQRGVEVTTQDDAVKIADVVILAVPDIHIGTVSKGIIDKLKAGSMVILLDPAAAYNKDLPNRKDITYFISHPCHPPIFNDEVEIEAKRDFFGGIKAKQAIVCAIMQGPEEDYIKGEEVAKAIYGPILRSHRITMEQMTMLEPTLAETISSCLVVFLGEALEETVRRGVPYDAARDFLLGHINVQLAIVFKELDTQFSDACKVAIEYGNKNLIQDGWQKLFDKEKVAEQVDIMLHPVKL